MKQFAVIGLGNFGFFLATHLYKKGHEVLAIDKDQDKIQTIRDQVSQAAVADATDREAMEALGLKQMDAVVICIRSDMSNSILATLNMKDVGLKRVLAIAISEAHVRILEKLGTSEVLFLEKNQAVSLAERMHNPNMIEYLPFLEGYSIIEWSPAEPFVGKSLHELDLINQYGVMVVAIKEIIPDKLHLIPTGHHVLKGSEILILLGPNEALDHLKAM